uniref:Integrin alpha-2 domain-containing protein n=1 Tax=Monopterus albus TaxID=43700 RepID=A0A3Q3QZ22_MONAL
MATGVFALLSVCVCLCIGFNLDTTFPLLKTGRDGSLFGLSVALHQDLKTDAYLLLIGAPRDKAEPNVPANRTGGVYSCPITADQSECSRMELIDPDLNLSENLIEDMWLGVSVASQGRPGGRVLACGHRFVKFFGPLYLRSMIGRCYLRGNDLQYDDTDFNWQKPDEPCNFQSKVSGEAMCNMGISASITQTEIIVGSPGSYEWQVNVNIKCVCVCVCSGYSVTQSRRLLSEHEETVVTGAPKDCKDDARGSVMILTKQPQKLTISQTLRGEQTGSYFGNAVATTDLNNDGWNDLLVGAPFYFDRQQELGGAVYVYMNTGGGFDAQPSVVLRGPAGSAFGMAVSAAGDLNQDGFQDFAVGAPFLETGSVMIWTGNSGGPVTPLLSLQVIQGSSVSPGFRTFGYSLAAGQDVDGNKYPDLLVGSLDDTVALLRYIKPVPAYRIFYCPLVESSLCVLNAIINVCFRLCLSAIHFTVAADITSIKSRLHFHDNRQSRTLSCISCVAEVLFYVCVCQNPIQNKVEPLVFSLNVSLYEKLPKKRNTIQDLKRFPVLSQTPRPIRTQKACGSDNRCHSNLQMTAQFTDENQKPFTIQMLQFAVNTLFGVNVSNTPSHGKTAEDAHNTVLNVSIPPSLIYSGVRTKVAAVECSVEDSVLLCEMGNPFKSNQKVQVLIIFQSEISLDTREIQALLQLSTHIFSCFSVCLIDRPGSAFFSGHVTGESAMKKTEDIGSLLLFTFQVQVSGKPLGYLGNLVVELDWPMEVSNEKWLLYLTEIQVTGTSEPCCNPPGNIVNPLNLTLLKEEEEKRERRSLEEEEAEEEGKTQKTLPDCVDGAKCVTFVCPLTNMNNTATLTVRARLWNSTMIEDYGNANHVLVRGRATLRLQTDKPTIIMQSHSTEIVVSIYPELGQQVSSGAPLWIIKVSVLAGVLLFALICLILWKCGFFRRASTRELYEAKTHKAHIKSQPSESERLPEEH